MFAAEGRGTAFVSASQICWTLTWLELAEGERHPLKDGCSLGRSPSNTLRLNHGMVSRRDAVIHRQGEAEFWLVDLGSSNGTLVNDRRLSHPVQLRNGDQMTRRHLQILSGQHHRQRLLRRFRPRLSSAFSAGPAGFCCWTSSAHRASFQESAKTNFPS
ncbi:MAG: FHA domain-containing protein [Nibricoccus sp.]